MRSAAVLTQLGQFQWQSSEDKSVVCTIDCIVTLEEHHWLERGRDAVYWRRKRNSKALQLKIVPRIKKNVTICFKEKLSPQDF